MGSLWYTVSVTSRMVRPGLNGTKGENNMPRVATKFDNHSQLGTFEQKPVNDSNLVSETVNIVASDKETEKSGEVSAILFKLAENADNPLDGALALFGGSAADLAKFAVTAYNDDIRTRAKSYIVETLAGPEKTLARTIKRIAAALKLDEEAVSAKVKSNPAYLDMFLALAKD